METNTDDSDEYDVKLNLWNVRTRSDKNPNAPKHLT